MNKTVKVSFSEIYPILAEKLKDGKTFSFCAEGVSMHPYIKGGKDIVTLGPVTEKLKKDDVVFYQRKNGQFVLHRIIKISDSNDILLCGDNQFLIEKGISKDQIFALLLKVEKDSRIISPEDFKSKLWCKFLPLRRFSLRILFPIKVFIKGLLKKKNK